MNDTLERSAETIIGRILELPSAARAAEAKRACAGDADLHRRVTALLSAAEQAKGFMDAPTSFDPNDSGYASLCWAGEKPGDMIGRYKLLEKVGEGGFGFVFTAEQQKPVRRLVALKVIKLGMDTREVIARFEAERQALALMDHPNIAKVLDAGSTDTGRPYFVMELVRGVPITEYADIHKLSTRKRVGLAAQVCRAVQHAHSKGIIHRDLKPSNVLVAVTDDKPLPKVIDFGIAKATHSRLTDRTLFTPHRQLIGTPLYMSPEQADSDGSDIDTRTDIYSLGVLLYELLVGTTPIDAKQLTSAACDSVRKVIRDIDLPRPATRLQTLKADSQSAIASARSTDVKKLSDSVKGELDWIVMKALEKDRTRRYDTAAALADDLDRHLAGEAVLAGPVSGTYRLKKVVRRYKAAVVIGSAFLAVLLLGVAGTTWGLMAAREQKAIADQRLEDKAATLYFLLHDILEKASPKETHDKKIRQVLVDTLITPALSKIGEQFKEKPLLRASLQETFAATLLDLGRPDLAEQQAKASWDARRRLLGEENPDTLAAMEDYALAIKEQGHYARAEVLLKQNWDTTRRVRGENHKETLTALSNYALAIDAQGRHAEAERLDKQLWDARRRVQGDDDPDTLMALNNYALAVDAQGRHAEAENLDKRLWEARRRVQGDDHPDTLTALDNYALAIYAQRRYAEAEGLFKRVWETSMRVQGDDHPDTLTALNNYAMAIYAQRRYAEAEPLFKRFWDASLRLMGEDHPDTLMALNNFAMVIDAQGRHADAEPLLKQLWDARRRVLGEDPDTLMALNNYALAIYAQGRYADAERLDKQLLEARRSRQGNDDPDTLMALNNYGMAIDAQGRHAEAEVVLKQAWDARRRAEGDDNPDTLTAMSNYARAIDQQGRHAEAERLDQRLLEARRRVQGDDDPDTLKALFNCALAIDAQGRHHEAEGLLKQVWDGRRRVLGNDKPETLRALDHYAASIDAQGRHVEALPLLQHAVERFRVVAPDHAYVGNALLDLGECLASQNNWAQAEAIARENDAWDKTHPAPDRQPGMVPLSLQLLNKCLAEQGKPTIPTTAPATQPGL